jgi:hypothetical protein
MKKSLLAGVLVSGLFCGAAYAEKINGVLIDAKCGAKPLKDENPEAAAAKHPKACCIKCGKDGDMLLISGKDGLKLDDASKAKAMEYLAKADSTKVTVEGEKKGDTLTITSIEAAK